jgi:hypothetical protein
LAVNVLGAVDVPLALFGGKNSELAPSDIPEGVSPDNQDVAFLPGSVFSRPGLHKHFASPLPNNATVVYAKSYVQPNGETLNLYLDSNGILWKEDVTNSPGTHTQLLQTQPGSYAKSCTAFGREYIAISDGEHGADVPLQYDGTNLDRVTQDGPGANPCTVQDFAQDIDIVSIDDLSSPQTIVAATCLGSTATIQTANAHGLRTDDLVLVDSVSVSGYNGTWKVTAVPSPTTFDFTANTSSLTAGTGGTEYPLTVVVTTDDPHGLLKGDTVVITGNTNSAYNNNQTGSTPSFWTVSAVPSDKTFEFQRITGTGGAGFSVTVTIPGKSMPWSPSSNPSYNYGLNDGTAPTVVPLAISAGNVLIIKATGSVTPSDSRPPAPPDGTPPATGTSGGSTGHHFPTLYMPGSTLGLAGVCGAITSGGGHVIQPVSLGSSRTLTVPAGGTELQAGTNDDHYSDNIGSFQLTVTLASGGGTGGTGGSVSIGGLSAPGTHQMVVVFETRQGFQTAPSIPVKVVSAGRKKIQVSNIPIGPDNVAKRILAFTGAGGDNFFYIPVKAIESGDVVATSTVLENNIDTSLVVDFADNTLFAATAIDIPGNNLFEMQTLTPCVGFFNYASRLFAWGERNNVVNFQNMGFDGGYDPRKPTIPLGWSVETPDHPGGELTSGDFGWAWRIFGNSTTDTAQGFINQRADQDYYGVTIIQPKTQYTVRVWGRTSIDSAAGKFVCVLTQDGTGELIRAEIPLTSFSANGNFAEANFSAVTPDQFTNILRLRINTENQPSGQTADFDELEIIYTEDPYRSNTARVSYVNAPEQFDGLTGNIGPQTDVTPLQCLDVLRDTLYFYTQSGIHSTNDNAGTEPFGWVVNQFANAVGICSLFSEDRGEEWHIIATRSGPRVFDGSGPFKVAQEIQPDWDAINWSAQKTIWVQNDVVTRRCYFGVPTGSNVTPNKILVLDYRELDTAGQVAGAAPLRVGRTGQIISADFSRKWTTWNIKANFANSLKTSANDEIMFFCGGNGQALGSGTGYGNVYYLDDAKLTDDNYGEIFPFYTTYFFIAAELAQAIGSGVHRKLFQYLSLFVSGVGRIQVTPLIDALSNNWPSTPAYTLSANPTFDLEFGLQALGERCAFKITPLPMPNQTDKKFNLQKMVVTVRQDAIAPVRGAL